MTSHRIKLRCTVWAAPTVSGASPVGNLLRLAWRPRDHAQLESERLQNPLPGIGQVAASAGEQRRDVLPTQARPISKHALVDALTHEGHTNLFTNLVGHDHYVDTLAHTRLVCSQFGVMISRWGAILCHRSYS